MKTLLDDCVNQLKEGVARFPWEDAKAYGDWLAQSYYYISHSTRLLAAAAARFPYDERGNALHHRFAAHMAEEKKHELLCIHDLKVLGTTVDNYPEHHTTRAFYEAQYFKIEHLGPIVLFGYILPLESISPAAGSTWMPRVTSAHGAKSAAFLKLHAEEDVEHIDKAIEALATATDAERRLIETNMRQTTFGYLAILQDIRRQLDVTPAVLRG
jgi:hypothetical protein